MIFADTEKHTIPYATRYTFVGAHRDMERMELLDAGEGLSSSRRMTKALFNELIRVVSDDESIRKGTTAAQALHTVLGGYVTGMQNYYHRLGQIVDPEDVEPPLIVGADGLRRKIDERGLTLAVEPITSDLIEMASPITFGLTHMVEQYNFPPSDNSDILQYHPVAHYSLGTMQGDAYQARQTLLTDNEQFWAIADQQQIGHFKQAVPVANVVKATL